MIYLPVSLLLCVMLLLLLPLIWFAVAVDVVQVAVAKLGFSPCTVIGADLLHLKEILAKSSGVLSIGGAGVFDGIALCGLFALLLT
jgi:uncharacterized membrane protein